MINFTNAFRTVLLLICPFLLAFGEDIPKAPEDGLRIMQLMKNPNGVRRYPDALPRLLKMRCDCRFGKLDQNSF